MYEHVSHPILPRARFIRRVAWHFSGVGLLMLVSLGLGMAGYCTFEQMPLTDAFLNTAMLLGGMGEVDALHTQAGKIFAGCYALYAGMIFMISAGVLLAPFLHRIFHKLHLDQ